MEQPQLHDAGARDLITGSNPAGLERTLFVEAGAGSGKTRSLVERVVALVGAGVELQHIAAITFTEKAAAELIHRIRQRLEEQHRADQPATQRWATALDQLDGAAISTLHAFAQRLLSEWPLEAGLPPRINVADELSAQVDFDERWEVFRNWLLGDPRSADDLRTLVWCGINVDDHLRDVARELDRNWDLLTDAARFSTPEDTGLDIRGWCQRAADALTLTERCTDPDDALGMRLTEIDAYRAELVQASDDLAALQLLSARKPSFKVGNIGRQRSWDMDVGAVRGIVADLGEQRDQLRAEHLSDATQRIVAKVREFVLQAARGRRQSGQVTFHDLLVLARNLLRGPEGARVRAQAARRYQRLLLDEFQDTDPIQIELAVLLAMKDPAVEPGPAWETEVAQGRLFFVGDPKQSIYRFRRADVRLFLEARTHFGSGEPVQLSTNFRTAPTILDWINQIFGRLITAAEGVQAVYQPLRPAPGRDDPPQGPPVAVLGAQAHDGALGAEELRGREAADVGDAILQILEEGWSVRARTGGWTPARPGDITILIPTRTSFAALEDALTSRQIPYRAEHSALVYHTDEVRDLHMALQAITDPSDGLAVVTTLRSPLFGCGDDDLHSFQRRYGGSWDYTTVSDSAQDHPVGRAMAQLTAWYEAHRWSGPADLMDRILRDRRVYELGYAGRRPRDLWRRLRFVVDQARAWSETTSGTMPAYLAWAAQQADERARVSEPILDETDDDAVSIMTIHAAKGLEFPITVLSGMSTAPQPPGSQVVWSADGTAQVRLLGEVRTAGYAAAVEQEKELEAAEYRRLLYVAATRAEDHLVVSMHREAKPKGTPSATLLADADAAADPAVVLTPSPSVHTLQTASPARGVPPEEPTVEQFQTAHQAIVSAADQPQAISVTSLARMLPATQAPSRELMAGLAKDPVDPETDDLNADDGPMPTTVRRGRYGTRIGRAVHGTLQTVDMDDPREVVEISRAQAAAEGVEDQHDQVRRLTEAALGSDCVAASKGHTRWRELYVAAPLGPPPGHGSSNLRPLLLEGYIDLLYRADDGLVIVDYKTASTSADLDQRQELYRPQGAAYAYAVSSATGAHVSRVVFCYLTPDGAQERELTDLERAITQFTVGAAGMLYGRRAS